MGEPWAKGEHKNKKNSAARSAGHDQTVLQIFVHINTLKSWKPMTFTQNWWQSVIARNGAAAS
jgi:hypothetical protein